jgi:hypothetical protein
MPHIVSDFLQSKGGFRVFDLNCDASHRFGFLAAQKGHCIETIGRLFCAALIIDQSATRETGMVADFASEQTLEGRRVCSSRRVTKSSILRRSVLGMYSMAAVEAVRLPREYRLLTEDA